MRINKVFCDKCGKECATVGERRSPFEAGSLVWDFCSKCTIAFDNAVSEENIKSNHKLLLWLEEKKDV